MVKKFDIKTKLGILIKVKTLLYSDCPVLAFIMKLTLILSLLASLFGVASSYCAIAVGVSSYIQGCNASILNIILLYSPIYLQQECGTNSTRR